MSTEQLTTWLVTLIVAGLGAWFGAFLREKGKNYATKEDIQTLTQLTEEVRANVTDQVWVRQRRWDLKRDLYWKLIENISDVDGAYAVIRHELACNRQPSTVQMEKWYELRGSQIRLIALAHLILSKDAIGAFQKMVELDTNATDMSRALGRPGEVSFTERVPIVEKLRVANQRLFDLIISAAKDDLILRKETPQ